jgi:adenine-specific DNA-methyltransferase
MGKTVYSVDDDLLLFCLEQDITAEFVEAMAELAPAKIVVAEMGFADDTAMANAHYILRDKGVEIKLV